MSTRTITPALARLLAEMGELVPLARIDRVWVFTPRQVGEAESGLVVLSLRNEVQPEADAREVVTVHYEARSGKGAAAPVREVTKRGWAPSARVPGLISGVVRRLGDDEEEPRSESIEGDPEVWGRFVEDLSAAMVDPTNGE